MENQDEKLFILIDSSESDTQKTVKYLQPIIEEKQARIVVFRNGEEALDFILLSDQVSLVITEYRLEGMGGLEIIERIRNKKPHVVSIILSGTNNTDISIKAIQAGAYDYLSKPCDFHILKEVISEALTEEIPKPPSEAELKTEDPDPNRIIGNSRAMSRLYRDLAKLAATPVTVLILGETGTGKELVAKALHRHGHRAHKPLIAVNCAAIPDNLLESELFGHERGAFTGATQRKTGRFEHASGATLFLDEIGDMQPLLQAKMLRVLQEKTIRRVGGSEEIPVDVRIIAATHQNLGKMVEDGTFRQDLFFRLNGATLRIPPLRDRLGDIQVLTNHFLRAYGKELGVTNPQITANALSYLARQTWPGNVRQLQNIIRQAILKKQGLTIKTDDLTNLVEDHKNDELGSLIKLSKDFLEQAEKNELPEGAYRAMINHVENVLLKRTLLHTNGNQSKAAKLLGITRFTLREKLKA